MVPATDVHTREDSASQLRGTCQQQQAAQLRPYGNDPRNGQAAHAQAQLQCEAQRPVIACPVCLRSQARPST